MSFPSDLQGHVNGRLIRGGTSRGLFVRAEELPVSDGPALDALALEMFGSPDPLQVDGIGGSHSHTSKLMIVEPSDRTGVDVDYTFGQVAVEKPVIGWGGNCGNLTSAIGAFALKEGMVEVDGNPTELTLYNTNTDTVVKQSIPIRSGEPDVYGDYAIDGVPGTGARIDSEFQDPAGGVLGSLTPTGSHLDTIQVDGEEIEISLVDVTNPCVYVRASDVGLEGTELPATLSERDDLLAYLERIRGTVCAEIGRVDAPGDAETESPTVPFLAIVSAPQSYENSLGELIDADDIDITARILTTQTPHHAYAMTGAMCLAAAARLPGTIPNEVFRPSGDRVTIGHPKGTISVGVTADEDTVESVTVGRTARELMRGSVYYRYIDELAELDGRTPSAVAGDD